MREDKEITTLVVFLGIFIIALVVTVAALIRMDKRRNSEIHSDDVAVTEWISPDGVHYWYQQSGYHAMLAPRYDSEGNLVIDHE